MKVPPFGSWLWRPGRAQAWVWFVVHIPSYVLILAVAARVVAEIGRKLTRGGG